MTGIIFSDVKNKIEETVTLRTNKKIQLRDTGLYIHSSADGKITISSDGTSTDDITLDGTVTISDDIALASGKTITGNLINEMATCTATGSKTWGGHLLLKPNSGTIEVTLGNPGVAGKLCIVSLGTVGDNHVKLTTAGTDGTKRITLNGSTESVVLISTTTTDFRVLKASAGVGTATA